jgi:RHS repeat-associated protein
MMNRALRAAFVCLLFYISSFQSYSKELSTDFQNSFGDFSNVGEYSFLRRSGTTSSSGTGPSSGANGTTHYAYLETSGGSAYTDGDQGILQINDIEAKTLTFYYHKYGADMGELKAEVYFNNLWHLLSYSSGQTQTSTTAAWKKTTLNLSNYPGKVDIRFVGTAEGGYRGDMAIDEITIDEQPNKLINFEADFGGMVNTGSYNLSRDSGGTPSVGTGPSSGANGTDYYTYFETSGGAAYFTGNTGMLKYNSVDADVMRFHYHMYGNDIGTLAIDKYMSNEWVRAWQKTGQQHTSPTDEWTQVYIDVKDASKLRFVTIASGGWAGDIAIDEIEFEPTDYYNHSPSFESGLRWINIGPYDWSLRSGATPSTGTGPSSGQGYSPYSVSTYAYVETSGGSAYYAGNTAVLESPYYEKGDFVRFYYSMIGTDIGTLYLEGKGAISGYWDIIWTKSGPQVGDGASDWVKAEVDISNYDQIRFKMVAAGGWAGDIAIDSIRMFFNGDNEGWEYEDDPAPYQAGDGVEYGFCAIDNDGVTNTFYRLTGTTQWIESNNCHPINLGELLTGGYKIETKYVDDLGNVYFGSGYFNVVRLGGNGNDIPQNIESPAHPIREALGSEDPLSSVVGTLGGQFRVDESGAATYTVPIAVPQGIAGVTPQLALFYSSAAGNGVMGVGWSITGRSEIQRCREVIEEDNATSGISLTIDDPLCLDGQRLVRVSGGEHGEDTASYRTKIDSMRRVTAVGESTDSTSSFSVDYTDGSTHHYKRVVLNSDLSVPTRWLLSSIDDNMNNTISFNYNESAYIEGMLGANEQVLTSVTYSDNTVAYYYNTTRWDKFAGYMLGDVVESRALLERVDVSNHHGNALRSYHMSYVLDIISFPAYVEPKRKRLSNITLCDDAKKSHCFPATEFDWTASLAKVETEYAQELYVLSEYKGLKPLDFNGDGIMDLSYGEINSSVSKIHLRPNNDGVFSSGVIPLTFVAPTMPGTNEEVIVWHVVDIDGNGSQDILYMSKDNGVNKWHSKRFDGPSPREDFIDLSEFDAKVDAEIVIMDADADGWQDIIYTPMTVNLQGDSILGSLSFIMKNTKGTLARYPLRFSHLPVDLAELDLPGNAIYSCYANNAITGHYISKLNFNKQEPLDVNGDGMPDAIIAYTSIISHSDNSSPSYQCNHSVNETSQSVYTRHAGYVFEETYNGYQYREAYPLPYDFDYNFGTIINLVGDINGDGLSDIVRRTETISGVVGWRCFLGTGNSLIEHSACNVELISDDAKNFSLTDMNGDGKSDLVYYLRNKWVVKYAQTVGFTTLNYELIDGYGAQSNTFNAGDYALWMNLDDDSHPDLLHVNNSPGIRGVSSTINVAHDVNATATPQDVITVITNGFGVASKIDYKALTDTTVYSNGAGAEALLYGNESKVFDIIGSSYVVSQVTSDAPSHDDASNTLTVAYQYEAMRAQAGGRGMLGFEIIRTYDMITNVTTETVYHQDYPFIGMPKKTRRYLGRDLDWATLVDTQKVSQAINTYEQKWVNGGDTVYPYLHTSAEQQFSLNDAGTATTGKISIVKKVNDYQVENDNHLNLQEVIVTTYDGSYADPLGTVTTTNTYDDNINEWWLGRVTSTTVKHSRNNDFPNADITRNVTFEYYDVGHNNAGMLKYERVEPTNILPKVLTTLHCYDSVGNATGIVTYSRHYNDIESCNAAAPLNVTTNHTRIYRRNLTHFDSELRYITSQQNDLFSSGTVTRNTRGQVTQSTDINGVITDMAYDSFGVQYASSNSAGAYIQSHRRLFSDAWVATPSVRGNYYFVQRTLSAGQPTTYGYFDRVGRQVAAVKQGFGIGEWIYQYSLYDKYGRVVMQSVPTKDNGISNVPDWNETNYDVFGRPQSITSADGTLSTVAYNGLSTVTNVTFDGLHTGGYVTQSTTEVKSVLGETVSVTDNKSGTIQYFHNATGNLTKVREVEYAIFTDPTTPQYSDITNTFDNLGRKTAMTDPDKGSWSYKYNGLGELSIQTNAVDELTGLATAESHVTTYKRDSLGRTVQRTVTGSSPLVSETTIYVFDEHQLAYECVLSGSSCNNNLPKKSFAYDSFGRPNIVTTTLEGRPYQQRTTYDQYGRVFQQFDAGSEWWGTRVHYNAHGYAYKQVEAYNSGGNPKVYQEVTGIDAFGHITELEQNNGAITTTKKYDALTGYVAEIKVDNVDTIIQKNHYKFDAIGNLRTRTRESLNTNYAHQSEKFSYDELNRLTHINNAEKVRYKANGNISWKADVYNNGAAYYCYFANDKPHAVIGVSFDSECSTKLDGNYEYDSNGNMTRGRGRAILYAHYDKPISIVNGQGSSYFSYDNNRKRYKRETTDNGVTTKTYYIGNVEIVYNDNLFSEVRRYLPGAIQTKYISTGVRKTRYLHKDHLGSINTITNEDGEVVEKLYFDAWGKKQSIHKSDWVLTVQYEAALNLTSVLNITPRGFTGHEHVDHADIIHMNGRIYDPTLGRFLQADPHIQAPNNSQSYNRFSYVFNNPLSYTDPSGFSAWTKFRDNILKPVVAIAISVWTGGVAAGYGLSWAGFGIAAAGGAASGFVLTGTLKGALTGAFSAAAFFGVGQAFGLASSDNLLAAKHGIGTGGVYDFGGLGLTSGQIAGQIASHAALGGVIADLNGGKFGHGFFSAGFAKSAGGAFLPAGNNLSNSQVVAGAIGSAVIGGTASKISGGKFANGASTGAFQFLYNQARQSSGARMIRNPESGKLEEFGNRMEPIRDDQGRILISEHTGEMIQILATDNALSKFYGKQIANALQCQAQAACVAGEWIPSGTIETPKPTINGNSGIGWIKITGNSWFIISSNPVTLGMAALNNLNTHFSCSTNPEIVMACGGN